MAYSRARWSVGTILAALVLAAAAIAILVFASARAEAAPPKFRVVTRDFANTAPILVPAGGGEGVAAPYPSSRNVAGFRRGKILDVNVVLRGFGHAIASADVDMALVGPGRTGSARILSDVGGVNNSVQDATIVIDDEAPTFMPQNSPLQGGRFMPTNYPEILDLFPNTTQPSGNRALSVFDGKDPNGRWRLFALDDEAEGGGAIEGGWSVTIKARVPR
jgi:hypothetical protein